LQGSSLEACFIQLARSAGGRGEAFNLIALRFCGAADDGKRGCFAPAGESLDSLDAVRRAKNSFDHALLCKVEMRVLRRTKLGEVARARPALFHNLRKAVSDYLNEGKKVDVRTIQDTLRHENPEMTLANYTESSLESRLAAQDVLADAIFSDLKRVQ